MEEQNNRDMKSNRFKLKNKKELVVVLVLLPFQILAIIETQNYLIKIIYLGVALLIISLLFHYIIRTGNYETNNPVLVHRLKKIEQPLAIIIILSLLLYFILLPIIS